MKKNFKRKICVITGTRAEYGLLKPIMKAIMKSKNFELQLLVVGAHLMPKFGKTINEIRRDGFQISGLVRMTAAKDTKKAMAQSIGRGIIGISSALDRIKPDIVLVLGDRIESLAGAIATVYMNIILAHIHGGDNPRAGLDEYARHAITKLSHIHFPATKKSAERIIKMGEDPRRVHVVGAPGLDSVLNERLFSRIEIAKKYKLDLSKPILLILQHSVTTDGIEDAPKQMRETMEAIKEIGHQSIVIYPNADAGGRKIIKIIESYRKYPFIRIYKNIIHKDYLSLMKAASAMVGNSSSGIIEATPFSLPVVNIGSRQEGRERAENIIDADYDKEKIKKAIKKSLKERVKKCKNLYGNGRAGIKISEILSRIKIDKRLIQKKITY